MENLTNKIYLDYNSTSPLASSVKDLLVNGDISFSNPSSIHSSGKKAYSQFKQASSDILKMFSLDQSHSIFFHSGSTEGVNTIVRGFAKKQMLDEGENIHFFYSPVDHSCVTELKEVMVSHGNKIYPVEVDANGQLDEEKLIHQINEIDGVVLLQFTYINNETGVIWDLDAAKRIKQETGCFIHVDCSQLPYKTPSWEKLSEVLDAYTFSGHKIGALKGTGFTIYKKNFAFSPLLYGGGQQLGARSGTINVLGAISCQLALKELLENVNFEELRSATQYLKDAFLDFDSEKFIFVAKDAKKAENTIPFIVKTSKSDILLAALDLGGVEVSAGSACAAGVLAPSKTLLAMGYEESEAKSFIRLSVGPYFNLEQAKECVARVIPIISKFL